MNWCAAALDQSDKLNIALISIDPSRRKSGGALLGDRIRMNAINPGARVPASTCGRLPRVKPVAKSARRCHTQSPPARSPA